MSLPSDKSSLFAAFDLIHPLNGEERHLVAAAATSRTVARGDVLLAEGEPVTTLFVVARGILRKGFVDRQGRYHLRGWVVEGGLAGAYASAVSNQPASVSVDVVEGGCVWQVELGALRAAVEAGRDGWERRARRLAEAALVERETRERMLLGLSAAERLAKVERDQPDLVARLRAHELASWVGITPESLSRLRRRQR